MRIFLNSFTPLYLAIQPLDFIKKLTDREIRIVFIALSAISCIVVSALLFYSCKRWKIEKQIPTSPIIQKQPFQKDANLQVGKQTLELLPQPEPAKEQSEIVKELLKETAESKENKPLPVEIPTDMAKKEIEGVKMPPKAAPKSKQKKAPIEEKKSIALTQEPIKPKPVTLQNGNIWEGGAAAGTGKGKMKTPDGALLIGDFVDGQLHGQGKHTDLFGEIKEGLFEKGVFKQGKISNNFPKRIGSKVYHNYQEGTFLNGMLHGIGKSVEYDIIREGYFADGKLHGLGRMIFEDGMVWEGTFINGKFNGEGSVRFRGINHPGRNTVVDPAIFQEILLVLESMKSSQQDLTGISICIGGIKESLPPVECLYVYQTIKGFAKLNENLDEFKKLLKEEGLPNIFRAKNISEFAFHKENSGTLISNIEYTLKIFAEEYTSHKNQGTLPNFLNGAFDPEQACFEARSEYLLNYHSMKLSH